MLASTQIYLYTVPYVFTYIYRGWQEVTIFFFFFFFFFFLKVKCLSSFFFFFFFFFFFKRARVLASTQTVPYVLSYIYRGWQEVTGKQP